MSPPDAPPARPTSVRRLIVLIAMLAAVLLYLERVCMSVAEVYIREDLHIGKLEMEAAFAAFFLAYAFGQVPSGWLSTRYGPRVMMTVYMLGWSVFGVFIAVAQDFYTLFAARFLLGLSQAGAYPTAALLVKRWVPDRSRGLASGVVAFGGRFGGAGANWLTGVLIVGFVPITTPATVKPSDVLDLELINKTVTTSVLSSSTTPQMAVQRRFASADGLSMQPADAEGFVFRANQLIREPAAFTNVDLTQFSLPADGRAIRDKPAADRTPAESERLNRLLIEKAFPGAIRQLHTDGWRPTLMLYGVLGIVVAVVFWVVARDWPRTHPWANPAEVTLIENGQSAAGQTAGTDAIPVGPLLRSRNQWLYSLNQVFSNYSWVFLITLMPRFLDERFAVPVDTRGLMTTVPSFLASFGIILGGWVSDRLSARYGRRWGRALPLGAMKFPCAALLAVCPFLPDPWTVTAALALMAVCQDFGIPSAWAFAQDTGGKQAATVLGWANMWGNLGAGVAILTTGRLADALGWDAAFYSLAWAFVLCGVCGLLADASRPLFPVRPPTPEDRP